jgi:mycoredoxin
LTPTSPTEEILMTEPSPAAVDFYWRPGCGFCMMLERKLGKAGVPLAKRNIWDDPADAAAVRAWANGNETVPTVVIDDIGLVNPSADEVIGVLASKAPHLVPEGWEPPQPGRIAGAARRLLGG